MPDGRGSIKMNGGWISRVSAFVVARRIGCIAALTGLLAGAMAYTSYENRSVFGRFSPSFAVLLGALAILLISTIIWSVLKPRRTAGRGTEALLLESAWACWGVAYLASALSDPAFGSRILDLNLFGSPFPVSALFEYFTLCLLLATTIIKGARVGRSAALNWGLVAVTVAALALLGEGAARLAAFVGAQTRGIPSYSGVVFEHRFVRLNHEGFRDVEHALHRRSGVRRLLLVGDSYAFGAGLRDTSERFGEQLQSALAAASGEEWEVIIVSRPGVNTLDETALLERGLAYAPDAVLLLYVFNDANYLAGRRAAGEIAERPGRAVRAEAEREPVFETPRSVGALLHPIRLLYWNSFLFQELYVRWRFAKIKLIKRGGSPAAKDVYRTPELLRQHLMDLARFVSLADSANTPVRIVPIDQGVPSDSDRTDRYRTFVEAARAVGLPVWTLGDAYRGVALDEMVVNRFDGHPNAVGIQLAVDVIAPKLLAEMLSPTDTVPSR